MSLQNEVEIRAAMDSGVCRGAIHPSAMPAGIEITEHAGGKQLSCAGGETIERFGERETLLTNATTRVQVKWFLADVAGPFQSVSQICGPIEGEGNLDVLFTNKTCVVASPGIMDAILRQITPIAQYQRKGGRYIADSTVSTFFGTDPKA